MHKLCHSLLLAAFKTLAPLQDPKSKQNAKDDRTHWLMGNVVPISLHSALGVAERTTFFVSGDRQFETVICPRFFFFFVITILPN